ncbi:RNase H domain-containing protein [Trichonephila clavipes]|nr:RNase H domain-containing protein [Trichonephila clavipes]
MKVIRVVSPLMRRFALEVRNGIPSDAILIYTDGSKDESNRTGSGAFIDKLSIRLSRRNPENCTVLSSELIAIDEGLKSILNRTDFSTIWILTDSRSAILHLQDWTRLDDLGSIRIINKLKAIAKYRDVHFQWIPSHVNVLGNEVADFLAKRGCSEIATTDSVVAISEQLSHIPMLHHSICFDISRDLLFNENQGQASLDSPSRPSGINYCRPVHNKESDAVVAALSSQSIVVLGRLPPLLTHFCQHRLIAPSLRPRYCEQFFVSSNQPLSI